MITQALRSKKEFDDHSKNPEAPIILVSADVIPQGITVFCKDCGIELFRKTSKNAVAFFSCFSNSPHTNRICARLAHRKDVLDTDIVNFDLGLFYSNLLAPIGDEGPNGGGVSPNGGGKGPDTGEEDPDSDGGDGPDTGEEDPDSDGGDGPDTGEEDPDSDGGNSPDIEPETMHIRTVPPRTIRDIIDLGLHRLNGNKIINHHNGLRVKDIILGYPSFNIIMMNKDILDEKTKIVEMKPLSAFPDSMSITCRMYHHKDNILFRLRCQKKYQYEALTKRLFLKDTDDKENSILQPKYRSIYVCGTWIMSKKKSKYNGNSCNSFICDIYNTRRQLYCDPCDIIKNRKEPITNG